MSQTEMDMSQTGMDMSQIERLGKDADGMNKINWGIMGAGRIAGIFSAALRACGEANLYAVGSRSLELSLIHILCGRMGIMSSTAMTAMANLRLMT